MPINSLALRLVAGAGLWVVVGLLVGGYLLSELFRGYVERNFDERLEVLLNSLVSASEMDAVTHENLVLERLPPDPRFEQAYSGWYWQILVNGKPVQRSRSLWDQVLPSMGAGGESAWYDIKGPEGVELRAVERSIMLPDSPATFHYTVAGDKANIQADVRVFNAQLARALAILGAGLLLAVFIQVRYGLQPLRRLRSAMVAVRSGQTARLEGSFPAEIKPLSDEINILLEHNAAVLERARTQVSNLAHALKTPLSVLGNEAAAASGPFAEAVRRQTEIIHVQAEHHLARARAAGTRNVLGARTEVSSVAEDLRRTLERIHRDRACKVELHLERGLSFRGERQDLQEMLGNLMDNGCKWGRSRVQLSATREGGKLRLAVDDDGPGLPEEERVAVFTRGTRLDESVPGTGLGLAIVRDIARLYGGEVSLGSSPLGGLRATLVLPSA